MRFATHRLQWKTSERLAVLVAPAPALADALEPQLDVEGQVVVDVEVASQATFSSRPSHTSLCTT